MLKTALITGATAGFGEATALLLASKGYRLIITGRRKERLDALAEKMRAQGTEVYTLAFDVRSREETDAAVDSLPEAWKTIDVFINNAGLAVGTEHLHEAVTDDWDRMIDTNVKGLLYVSRKIVPLMVQRKSGHIINVGSIAGREAYPGGSVYCATKHAVQAITNSLRIEMLPHGIRVGLISPGLAETEFSEVRFKGNTEKANSVYNGLIPLYAPDIADTILFMLSAPAHVNIADVLILPTIQASARDVLRK
ncbi:MAG: SDR family NAD(P)-dependent oxidoreductase [Bacteroidales bacterium]|nr:SDR family NAD(P)-dependent oxidoreductase [Bacteroidales bacterium]